MVSKPHKAAADTLSDKPAQHWEHTYLALLLLWTPNTLGCSLVILGTCVGFSLGEAVGWSQKCKRCFGGNACKIRSRPDMSTYEWRVGRGEQEDGRHLWEVWPQGQLQCRVRPSWAEVPESRALLGSALAWELQGGAWPDSGASMDPKYCSWSLV